MIYWDIAPLTWICTGHWSHKKAVLSENNPKGDEMFIDEYVTKNSLGIWYVDTGYQER